MRFGSRHRAQEALRTSSQSFSMKGLSRSLHPEPNPPDAAMERLGAGRDPSAKRERGIEQGRLGESCFQQHCLFFSGGKQREPFRHCLRQVCGIWRISVSPVGKTQRSCQPKRRIAPDCSVMGHNQRAVRIQAAADLRQYVPTLIPAEEMQGEQTGRAVKRFKGGATPPCLAQARSVKHGARWSGARRPALQATDRHL